jgi:DNA-binding PadR family transcriptional regulator
MAAPNSSATRLLVLGAVCLFEPVNGYQIRRELMSWEVDRWAHVNPGSVYSALTTLAKQGHLLRHEVPDGSRQVAVYTTTDAGRAELAALFGRALEGVEPLDPLPLHTAVSLCSLFPRDTVAGHLAARTRALDLHLSALREKLAVLGNASPPQVSRTLQLQVSVAEVEARWVRDLLQEIRSGGMAFAGEPADWRPDPDDPGWQMAADRERYRALLGLD